MPGERAEHRRAGSSQIASTGDDLTELPDIPAPDRSAFLASQVGLDLYQGDRFRSVEPAFCFCQARPAPGSHVFSEPDSARAMGAADARIALVVQRIVGDIVFAHVTPDHF